MSKKAGNGVSIQKIDCFNHYDSIERTPRIIIDSSSNSLIEVKSEIPIIKYIPQTIQDDSMALINSFVRNITVSILWRSKIHTASCNSEISTVPTEDKVVVYYENLYRQNIIVGGNSALHGFIMRKPNLVVSPEGMLLFYDEKEMIATFDMVNYVYVSSYYLKMEANEHIQDVIVKKDNNNNAFTEVHLCKVKTCQNGNTTTFESNPNLPIKVFRLKFNFNFEGDRPINISVS